MILYAIITWAAAVLFAVIAVLIYRGKTGLIHDYHQSKVKDSLAYGKAFGKALAILAVAMAFSGAVSLLGDNFMWGAVAVLAVGMTIGIIAIIRVQNRYNGGLF